MSDTLIRVGTTYIPVSNVEYSADWYVNTLSAELSYQDADKAIINLANQSFFLVKAGENQSSNFFDYKGEKWFSVTFEVDGLHALQELHRKLLEKEVRVEEIENRGHAGRNFVLYDPDGNAFDVWSELSPTFNR
ncbi:VOC family protein [Robertmurraya korlensis]|uniref:VOC family protein n=1 Tax=Robertmurraya korlensis TaxID=519977 RepID=UPI000825F6B6|nr:VOC family protein [Robertmurraya korlensis]